MNDKKELESIVRRLESGESIMPSLWFLRGLYVVNHAPDLTLIERRDYKFLLHDLYVQNKRHDYEGL